jgi:hypothetical protein
MSCLDQFTIRHTRERRRLPSGRVIDLPARILRLPANKPPKLPVEAHYFEQPDRPIPASYTVKPLVTVDGRPAFGELAIRHCLEADRDGWDGVWVDTYHSRGNTRLFWRDLPDRSHPVDLTQYPQAYQAYCRILDRNKGGGGFFDVLAWKSDRVIFIEYKGNGDGPNKNEARWIDAALAEGFDAGSLSFALY